MTKPPQPDDTTKTCARCGQPKPHAPQWRYNRWRLRSVCRDCRRLDLQKYNASPKGRARTQHHETTKGRREARASYDRERHARQREAHPLQDAARQAAGRAKRAGKLTQPTACESCGLKTDKLQMDHHHGYERAHWLDVRWLCSTCHSAKDNRALGGAIRWHGPDPEKWPEHVRRRTEETDAQRRLAAKNQLTMRGFR